MANMVVLVLAHIWSKIVDIIENLRLRIGCKIISWGIRLMPEDWRNKKAINNLMVTNMIQNTQK